MDQPKLVRRLIGIAIAAVFLLFVAIGAAWWYLTREGAALLAITNAYEDGEYAAVVDGVDRFFSKYPVSDSNAWALLWKAESQYQIGKADTALGTWQDGLAKIESVTNNVTLREYVSSYLRFAEVLRERGRAVRATEIVDKALRLEPQNVQAQIFRGQLLEDQGDGSRALAHYQKQRASSVPVSEERAVLAMKIAHLTSARQGQSTTQGLESLPLYVGLSIGLVPVNQAPHRIVLEDVCTILEMSWRVRCDVLPSIDVEADGVWVERRNQYDASALLAEVRRRLPWPSRRHSHIVALTEYDIFGPQTSFVFSWQGNNDEHGEGVLSTSRFVEDLPAYYEPDVIATRRVAIQALSTTGRMFSFERPTDAECPLAYPESLREFQMKRLRLCAAEEEQRDALLQKRGGDARRVGPARARAIERVMQRYFVE